MTWDDAIGLLNSWLVTAPDVEYPPSAAIISVCIDTVKKLSADEYRDPPTLMAPDGEGGISLEYRHHDYPFVSTTLTMWRSNGNFEAVYMVDNRVVYRAFLTPDGKVT